MTRTLTIVCTTLLLLSCATMLSPLMSVEPECVPRAVYAALAFRLQTGCEVRVVILEIRPGYDHAQAQAKIEGNWMWINQAGAKHSTALWPV